MVYAQVGQTVKDAVGALPPTGGMVVLGMGAWPSGYVSGQLISRSNITIQGSGRPGFNSTFTAMVGGTIILGNLPASTGADYLTVRDLGVDAGLAYINADNGGVPTDALAIVNNGQVIGAPQVESPVIDNVACLGYSTTAAFHCMLVENVNHAWVHNIVTVMNQHGFVLKGTNSIVDGVFARGHGIDSIIVKSDNYAPASQNELSNITVQPLLAAGDTKGIVILGLGAAVSDITLSHAQILSPLAWGIYVQGASSIASAANLSFSDITINYPGGSPTSEYCMQFVEHVSNVHISDLNCHDMWKGIAPYLPASSGLNGFTIDTSNFENIETDAVETFGAWNISGSQFKSIAGNGIVNPNGITTVYGNTFTNIGGTDMLPEGGSFILEGPPPTLCLDRRQCPLGSSD